MDVPECIAIRQPGKRKRGGATVVASPLLIGGSRLSEPGPDVGPRSENGPYLCVTFELSRASAEAASAAKADQNWKRTLSWMSL